jgi:NAD(P)H dehydrogenase (quinone)
MGAREKSVRASIIFAHPEPLSFNAHLARAAACYLDQAGYEVQLRDLYGTCFDPREAACHYTMRRDPARFDAQTEQRYSWEHSATPADVKAEIDCLFASDLVIFQFPLWWFGPPGILKGWLDRVFIYGGVYRSSARYDRGTCRGKRALACVTTGASESACSYNGNEGDTKLILWPFLFSLRYVGFTVLEPNIIYGVRSGLIGLEKERKDMELAKAEENYLSRLSRLHEWPAILYNADHDFDQSGRLNPDAPVYSPFIRRRPDLPL